MHNAAFGALALNWSYELRDVSSGELPGAIQALRADEVAGANVTIPHKQAAMEMLDLLDPQALRARAVNTIVNAKGRLSGTNTDVEAIRAAAAEVGLEFAGARIVVLGAGGSARAAAVALEGAQITFVARRAAGADLPGAVIAWGDPSLPSLTRAADLLVNATPLGRRGEMPIRPAGLPRRGAVIDLVYVTGGTPLVRKARTLGLRTADGWGILLAQGALSFEAWTGRRAPIDVMRQTLHP